MLLNVVLCLLLGWAGAIQEPSATVTQGKLRGRRMQTHAGRTIYAYFNIPYAKPPVGELRFKEPQPAEPWKTMRDAKREGNACIQKDYLFSKNAPVTGDEDCLYLNVYTTQLNIVKPEERVPVMVYIHGGAWQCGSGIGHGPEYLLDHDIILVTFNYRLGPLGFLSTEDEHSPGNYGMKDQVAALKWVQENAAAFGGDPERVTIFGQSGGAASVQYHLMSPMSRGLFHRAISISGNALAPWASARQPALQARRLAKLLDCPEEPSKNLVSCMRQKDARLFVDAAIQLNEWDVDPVIIFSPSLEPNHSGKRFIPAPLPELIKESERFSMDNSVPWMTGFTAQDASMRTAVIFSNEVLLKELDKDFERVAPITLRFRETAKNNKDVARKIRQFYFKDKPIEKSTMENITNMYTDRHLLVPLTQSVAMMKKFGSKRPIYLYRMSHRGTHSVTSKLDPTSTIDYGVCHLDDLQYIFHMPEFYPTIPMDPNHDDYRMMTIMTNLFTEFAETGMPTSVQDTSPHQKKDEKTFYWSETSSDAEFADLNLPLPTMIPGKLDIDRRDFWKSLKLEEHTSPAAKKSASFHTEL